MNIQDFEPIPLNQGPPIPEGLSKYLPFNGKWPWYKSSGGDQGINITLTITDQNGNIVSGS
jgi:hypothetical protein